MIRLAARCVQISAFLVCGTGSAFAETPKKVTTFAAPADFTHFLHKHDSEQGKFDFTDKWVDPEKSDVIVVFIENREDIDFVPAKLYSSFQTVLSIVDTHFYQLSSRVFGDTLNSDVYIVSVSRLQTKLVEDGFSTEQAQKGAFISCFAAGLVEDFYRQGNLNANHRRIGDTCVEYLENK
ncbi:hypothetical protein [Ruegeria sp. YS9]|uniref:hypothetical protein n=1 Tax=Ruegeria sp. YS9 TaxID=2966453 RepID=UPI00214B7FB8|nr:hypothetical protein [Ruegeria sp. YS9]UUV06494.1 hypothetical protein NOR97_01710 [Ruegeria sp. YS9]